MGERIAVDGEGLLSHAGVCDTAAAAIPVPVPPAAGHVTQATTAAVAQGNALLDAGAAQLSRRATATSTTLRAAAGAYVTTDSGNGQAISTTVQV
ncbi:type VII secretion target [Mycolicibacterium mucogenicum]|uniref:type VII secretion target n=1 Tax=Mycolicibacterium mucogenicum TaxID=56689 RepID=UPI00226A1B32|nr:type VII secretion target [Mycolicibacterium mucogenicum]MCX8559224.1 type VII secretion target [Mycolicibacterium mucogenicum]